MILINFQKYVIGFGKEFNKFLKDLAWALMDFYGILQKKIDFQRNLKGIRKEFNWFPKEIQNIWKGIQSIAKGFG